MIGASAFASIRFAKPHPRPSPVCLFQEFHTSLSQRFDHGEDRTQIAIIQAAIGRFMALDRHDPDFGALRQLLLAPSQQRSRGAQLCR